MFYFAGILFSRARIDTDLREQICQQFMPLIDFLRDGQPGISESNMVVFVNGDISAILKVSHGDRNGRLCY